MSIAPLITTTPIIVAKAPATSSLECPVSGMPFARSSLCRISKRELMHRPDKEVGRLSGTRQQEGIARQLGDIRWLQKQLRPIGLSSNGVQLLLARGGGPSRHDRQ